VFTARTVTAQDVGNHFAQLLRDYPAARRLWVASDVDGFNVDVLTRELDAGSEREIYSLGPLLRQKTPTVVSNVLLVNPAMWPFDSEADLIAETVPPSASEIPLGPS
jgi:hypothetical protein